MRPAGTHVACPLCVTRPQLAFVCVTDPCRREVRVSKARRLVLQDNGT